MVWRSKNRCRAGRRTSWARPSRSARSRRGRSPSTACATPTERWPQRPPQKTWRSSTGRSRWRLNAQVAPPKESCRAGLPPREEATGLLEVRSAAAGTAGRTVVVAAATIDRFCTPLWSATSTTGYRVGVHRRWAVVYRPRCDGRTVGTFGPAPEVAGVPPWAP